MKKKKHWLGRLAPSKLIQVTPTWHSWVHHRFWFPKTYAGGKLERNTKLTNIYILVTFGHTQRRKAANFFYLLFFLTKIHWKVPWPKVTVKSQSPSFFKPYLLRERDPHTELEETREIKFPQLLYYQERNTQKRKPANFIFTNLFLFYRRIFATKK
jgi:hypothetical protein